MTLVGADDEPSEAEVLIQCLEDRGFTAEDIARVSEWILRGDPARFRKIDVRSFYPTAEQLESLGVNIHSMMAKEYRRGYIDGERHGANRALDSFRKDEEHLILLSSTQHARELEYREKILQGREQAYEESLRRLEEREREVAKVLKVVRRGQRLEEREEEEKKLQDRFRRPQ